jgi:hypothetical protein
VTLQRVATRLSPFVIRDALLPRDGMSVAMSVLFRFSRERAGRAASLPRLGWSIGLNEGIDLPVESRSGGRKWS